MSAKSHSAIRPLAEDLHRKLSESHRTAIDRILANPDRWQPPAGITNAPSDADLTASRKDTHPSDKVTPELVWASPFSLLFHRVVPAPTMKFCFTFAELLPSGVAGYLCVSKDPSQSVYNSELTTPIRK
jgi:hypothetical protein